MKGDTPARAEARRRLAAEVGRMGPRYANAAESIRCGSYGNIWTEAALAALERTTSDPIDPSDD